MFARNPQKSSINEQNAQKGEAPTVIPLQIARSTRDQASSTSENNQTPPQNFLHTALRSNTTYSSLGSALYSTIFISFSNPVTFAISALPTLAYLALGYIALKNEHKKSNSNDTKTSFLNPIKFLSKQLQDPPIFRYYRSGILVYQAVLSIYRLNFFDTGLFLLGVAGNYFAGRETASLAQTSHASSPKSEPTNDTTTKNVLRKISSTLFTSPGFYWICWGAMAGFRDLGFGNVTSTLLNLSSSNPLQLVATLCSS